jgi:hypothetical protein
MSPEALARHLKAGRVVRMTRPEWESVADALDVVERHDTFLKGDLLIVSTKAGLAAVEAPSDAERVVRRLGDRNAARRFVTDRLETYERMWNGCGCRIDYYK